ncbi:MAG: stage II sporulation protein M [Actinophytocola sp.]|nr:stage II sporulation protein M [Actinophytocola sp.]
MDIDVFVAQHRAEWDRLRYLVRRARKLRGPEADELVALYQRTATHLSIVRSTAPDPALLSKLSSLVAQGRAAVAGSHNPSWREFGLFFSRRFPAAIYRARMWWIPVATAFLLVSGALAAWVATDVDVRGQLATPAEIKKLTAPGGDFESYYSSAPAASFAFNVWTNNVWVSAGALTLGVLFGIPVVVMLLANAANVAVAGGMMASVGRLDIFLGLITPHGLLELTAVFVAGGLGLKLGWTVIDPGRRSRSAALAQEGRAVIGVALGLVAVLLISGVIEAFVTPSGLPTAARIGIGVLAEVLFLAYVFVLGRRAAHAGETGDIDQSHAGASMPATG